MRGYFLLRREKRSECPPDRTLRGILVGWAPPQETLCGESVLMAIIRCWRHAATRHGPSSSLNPSNRVNRNVLNRATWALGTIITAQKNQRGSYPASLHSSLSHLSPSRARQTCIFSGTASVPPSAAKRCREVPSSSVCRRRAPLCDFSWFGSRPREA